MRRNRAWYLFFTVAALLLSLGSRRFGAHLPAFVARYAGDTLWALGGFLGLGFLFARARPHILALAAAALGLTVELLQLWQPPALQAFRATPFGGILLGHGFLWSDLACYAIGVTFGFACERLTARRSS